VQFIVSHDSDQTILFFAYFDNFIILSRFIPIKSEVVVPTPEVCSSVTNMHLSADHSGLRHEMSSPA
jgi:hypothetical protein